MSFKENLKSELEYQGLQLKELATKTGISKNTLGNYLTGHNSLPTADTAVKIAQALDVSVEYLVTGKSMKDLLSPKHQKLLADFEKLDATEQKAVSKMIETLAAR